MRGVSPSTLSAAVATAGESGRPLRDVLVDDGMVTEVEFAEALAEAYGLNAVELDKFPIDVAATAKIPLAMARRHRVLGVAMDDDEIVVAIADPGDVLALDDVRAATGMTRAPGRRRPAADLLQGDRAVPARRERPGRRGREPRCWTAGRAWRPRSHSVGDEAPIVRYVNSLIEQAIDNRASDLHIEPAEHDLRVRFRIDGVLHEMDTVPREHPVGADQPAQDHVRRRHHRAPGAAERPDHRRAEPAHGRPARGHAADRLGREDRPAGARHRRHRPRTAASSASARENYKRFSASFTKPHGHAAGHRADRLGQVDDAVRDADRDQQARDQHHHRRGPGRVPAARGEPGAGEPQGRADLRRGAAGDPALRPGRRADRRDPRPGHRAARGRGVAHRSPRAVDAAHQRRARRPSPGSSRWASSRSSSGRRSTA